MTPDQIIVALLWLTMLTPHNRVRTDPEYATEITNAVVAAQNDKGIPAQLLISVMYHESSFNSKAIGKLGEIGLGQVHGLAKRGCDLSTARGQVECSASWLARWKHECPGSDWHNPLVGYASGSCHSDSERLHRKIRMRESLARRIVKYVSDKSGRGNLRIAASSRSARENNQVQRRPL